MATASIPNRAALLLALLGLLATPASAHDLSENLRLYGSINYLKLETTTFTASSISMVLKIPLNYLILFLHLISKFKT